MSMTKPYFRGGEKTVRILFEKFFFLKCNLLKLLKKKKKERNLKKQFTCGIKLYYCISWEGRRRVGLMYFSESKGLQDKSLNLTNHKASLATNCQMASWQSSSNHKLLLAVIQSSGHSMSFIFVGRANLDLTPPWCNSNRPLEIRVWSTCSLPSAI